MTRITLIVSGMIVLFLALSGFSQEPAATGESAAPCFRAEEGDTVWVILNQIKADKCEQFEELVLEGLFGGRYGVGCFFFRDIRGPDGFYIDENGSWDSIVQKTVDESGERGVEGCGWKADDLYQRWEPSQSLRNIIYLDEITAREESGEACMFGLEFILQPSLRG